MNRRVSRGRAEWLVVTALFNAQHSGYCWNGFTVGGAEEDPSLGGGGGVTTDPFEKARGTEKQGEGGGL